MTGMDPVLSKYLKPRVACPNPDFTVEGSAVLVSRKGNEGNMQQARVARGMQHGEPCFILFSLSDLLELSPWVITWPCDRPR